MKSGPDSPRSAPQARRTSRLPGRSTSQVRRSPRLPSGTLCKPPAAPNNLPKVLNNPAGAPDNLAAASILKDAVNRIGDLLDDRKVNASFKG